MTAEERQAKVREIRERNPGTSVRSIVAALAAEGVRVSIGTVHRDLNPKAAARYRVRSRDHRRKTKRRERAG